MKILENFLRNTVREEELKLFNKIGMEKKELMTRTLNIGGNHLGRW